MNTPSTERGFTLLEVVVSLGILALSMSVLLESQMTSIANAGRSRDLTVASLLARAKMIDIEQKLFDEGFTLGDQEEEGDFTDYEHPDIKWRSHLREVRLDVGGLLGMCDDMGGEDAATDCGGLASGMGAPLDGFTEEIGRSLRLVELEVLWGSQSMKVTAMVTDEHFKLAPPGP